MRGSFLLIVSWVVLSCGGREAAPTAPGSADPLPNPFLGESLYVDPYSSAALAVTRADSAETADLLRVIAEQPQADWLGEWSGSVGPVVNSYLTASAREEKLRVMIVYNIPNRDCGLYSKGGVSSSEKYTSWISEIAAAVGDRKAVFVLEPDALGQLDMCLSDADQVARLEMMQFAVNTLGGLANTAVYIDAGNANWVKPGDMAERLQKAGIASADGFALNTSNYVATEKTVAYGMDISERLGGNVPFIVDTSRNGQGEAPDRAWCNPPGRGLGTAPTSETGNPLVHAFLWLKRPGESDGTCNDGPPAGAWYEEQALELIENGKL